MKVSILIPHWKTGEMTAYAIYQLLQMKGRHDIQIVVIDNNAGDGSEEYLEPFKKYITYVPYPKHLMQSHGIAFDYVLENGIVENENFVASESDAFPVRNTWLDYLEEKLNEGYDSAVSFLKLSGGEFGHPTGGIFKKSIWREAKKYWDQCPYFYFPNMAMKEKFACHTMIHKNAIGQILNGDPEDWIILADGYKPYDKEKAIDKMMYYRPTAGVFHNGMGMTDESVKTYGFRNPKSEVPAILVNGERAIIKRIGYEPGQSFYYWQLAMGRKIFHIPTQVKWIDDKDGTQQEYTLTENGFYHAWGVSAYHGDDLNNGEIAKIKRSIPKKYYSTLPKKLQI